MTETKTLTPAPGALVFDQTPRPLLPARPPTRSERRLQTAQAFVQCGYFTTLKGDPKVALAKAFVTMLYADELGLKPIAALTGIDIVEGKPRIGSNLIARRVRKSGRYDYRVLTKTDDLAHIEWLEREDGAPGGFVVRCLRDTCGFDEERETRTASCAKCQGPVTARRLPKGWAYLGETSWTPADAERAGLKGKDNWKKYGRQMLFNRAMSEGYRAFCPDVFDVDVLVRDDDEPAATPPTSEWVDTDTGEVKTIAPEEEDLPAPAPTRAKGPAAAEGGAA